MAHIVADRVKETTTTTGTGNLTLAGAASGFRAFSAVCATNDTVWYCVAAGSEWEVGLGTYSATNTLTRTAVTASSNSGSAVNLTSGTKDVFLTDAAAAQGTTLRPRRSGATYYDVPGVSLRGWATPQYDGGYIHYFPFYPRRPIVVNAIRFRVQTAAGSGHTGRVAIYRSDEHAQPLGLIASTTGIAITATGVQSATITGTQLLPIPYLLAFWATANVNLWARYGSIASAFREGLDEYDVIRALIVFRDPTANTAFADPGTAWSTVHNTNGDFEHPLFLDIAA